MKRRLIILGSIASLAAIAVVTHIVGFRYSVGVDNRATDFPNAVVNVDGLTITLDDGRVLRVGEQYADVLAEEIKESEYRVRFDANERMLHTMRYARYCGLDRPESRQLVTMPLKRVDFPRYWSKTFAEVREVRRAAGS